MEAIHFTVYGYRYVRKPILDVIDNINNITQTIIKECYATYYIRKDLIIVGTCDANYNEFVDIAASQFENLKYKDVDLLATHYQILK
jgi:predicted Zn-dependent peptidase